MKADGSPHNRVDFELARSTQAWVKRITQAITKEVEGKHNQEEGKLLGRALHVDSCVARLHHH